MLYSVDEVAELIGVSVATIYRKLKMKELQPFIVRKQGKTYIKQNGLLELSNILNIDIRIPHENNNENIANQDENIENSRENLDNRGAKIENNNENIDNIENHGAKIENSAKTENRNDLISALANQISLINKQLVILEQQLSKKDEQLEQKDLQIATQNKLIENMQVLLQTEQKKLTSGPAEPDPQQLANTLVDFMKENFYTKTEQDNRELNILNTVLSHKEPETTPEQPTTPKAEPEKKPSLLNKLLRRR